MIATAPPSETGTLGAVYNTAGQLGSAVGMAIMTAVINGVNNGATDMSALPGYHAAFYVNIGLLGISTIVSILFIKDEPRAAKSSEEDIPSCGKSEETLKDLEKGEIETIEAPANKNSLANE